MRVDFIENYPIDRLTPANYNPRKLDDDKFKKLQESLRRFGIIKPVIVNGENGVLTAGHQRTKTMKSIGITHCPVIRINGISRTDEIKFNLFHNSIETNKSECYVSAKLIPGTYQVIQSSQLSFKSNDNPMVCKAMGDLCLRYGEWGSIICNSKGKVLFNSDYVVTSKLLGLDVICYTIHDKDEEDVKRLLNVEYGQYYYDTLGVKSYNQFLCQMKRLTDGSKKALKSSTYEKYVIPRLNKALRYIDFGAGRCAYANKLAKQGYHILPYEPHFQVQERLAIKEVVRQIRSIEQDIARHGLFDVVVLDSVLNSVVNPKFEHFVMTACNALARKNGSLIIGTRGIHFLESSYKAKKWGSHRRSLQFLDKDNFSVTYRGGLWTMQHFHTEESLVELCSQYFHDVEILPKSSSQIYTISRRPKKLSEEKYREALNIEFNMEYPNNYRHNQHEKLVELIIACLKEER